VRKSADFRFRLPGDTHVTLEIFDASGARVVSLRPRAASAGWHVATWGGERADGERAVPGIYFARLAAGRGIVAKRLVLLPR
jgi:flagellar hook assembly protein FlgD